MRLGQRLGLGFTGRGEMAQVAFDGARYYRTADGVYLKDFGHGNSDDSAKLYSGQMLDFDGVDDYIDTAAHLVDGDSYTLAVTFNNALSAGSDNDKILINSFYGQHGFLTLSGYHLEFRIGSDATTIKLRLLDFFPTDITRIVLSVVNGGSASVFVDGVDKTNDLVVYEGVNANINTAYLTNRVFRLGASTNGTTTYAPLSCFNGQIGNAQIWNKAFTADDVAYDYNNLHHMKTADENPDSALTADNLKCWPALIEGSGDVAYDWIGNGNHSTLTNFPASDTQWSNADALDSPLVPQTALLEWGYADGVVCPLDTTNVSRTITDESFFVTSYDVAISLDHLNLTTSSVIVTTTDGLTTYVEDTDYTIDYVNGTITVLSTGTMEDSTEAVVDESFTSSFDIAVSLAHSDLVSGSVVVTTTDGVTTYVEDTDYTIDYTNGTITVLSTGAMLDATAYYIDYTYNVDSTYYIDYTYEVDATNFTRNYSELNLNGRSFPVGLTGADVAGAMTATVEMVVNIDDVTDLQYLIDCTKDAGIGAINQTAGTIATSSGTVYVNNVATTAIASGLAHVVVSGISLNASELFIGRSSDSTSILLGQLPMCKIYEETWDAAKVATYYAKAAAKYNL